MNASMIARNAPEEISDDNNPVVPSRVEHCVSLNSDDWIGFFDDEGRLAPAFSKPEVSICSCRRYCQGFPDKDSTLPF